MKLFELIIAQASQPTTAGSDPITWWGAILKSPFILIIGMLLIFTILRPNPKRNEQKTRQEMLKQLKGGDRIETIGGIQGSITKVEEARVQVKVDESNNTKMWFAKTAIARLVDAEKSDSK